MRRLNYETKDLGFSFACVTAVMVAAGIVLELIFGTVAGGWKFWLMQGLYTSLIGASAVFYALFSKTKFFVATKLNKAPNAAHTLWGCASVVFLVLVMSQVNNLFLDILKEAGLSRPSVSLENNVAGLILCACILPAFAEEIVFRGTVAQSLYNCKSQVVAVVVSGALFSVFHANPAQTLHQFVLGMLLTLIVFRSGSLWTSVIVHLFNNAFVVALSYTPLGDDAFWNFQTNAPWAFTLTIVGFVGFVLCTIVYVATTRSRWQPLEDTSRKDSASDEAESSGEKSGFKYSIAMLFVAIAVCALLWVSQLIWG